MIQKPEEVCLWLPSTLPHQVPCDTKLQDIEWNLHYGQAHDALTELHQTLCSCSYMLHFKDHFLREQGANTHAHNSLKAIDVKVNTATARYHTAYRAMVTLSPLLGKTGWQNALRPLTDEDIHQMTTGTEGESEGHRWVSWIWLTCGQGEELEDGEHELQDGMLIYLLTSSSNLLYIMSSYPYQVAKNPCSCTSLGRRSWAVSGRTTSHSAIPSLAVELVAGEAVAHYNRRSSTGRGPKGICDLAGYAQVHWDWWWHWYP